MDTADGLSQLGRCPEGYQQLPDGILQSGAAPRVQWGTAPVVAEEKLKTVSGIS